MPRRRILLCQPNNLYGRSGFLPYSVGLIRSYAESCDDLKDAYEFAPFVFLRERPEEVISRTFDPSVVGFSVYIWNAEWSKLMARFAREAWPDCLIIFGGPQVPADPSEFFHANPSVDLLVRFEGEVAFSEILRERLRPTPDYTRIAGVTARGPENVPIFGPPPERIADLSKLPSPYLSGLFDGLLGHGLDLHAVFETNRGCVFECTFCQWGSELLAKMRKFDDTRLLAEIAWMGEHRIELCYSADANWGILPRDLDLTDALITGKARHGFPQQFRAAYSKNANDRIFEIGNRLNKAGMNKGVTLALQSTDAHTLELIKRKNMDLNRFEEWVRKYDAAGIPTYTEIILGLPGETYDSFADGLDRILSAGQHHGLHVYLAMLLPDSEMADPEYIKAHGIRTVRGPLLQQHATPDPTAEEMAEIVIGTKTMPEADWLRAFLFAWAVQTFHSLGLTTQAAIAAVQSGSSYRRFYEGLLQFFVERPGWVAGSELLRTTALVTEGMAGGPWGCTMPGYGPVIWPSEEASFLWMVGDLEKLYAGLMYFTGWMYGENRRIPVIEGLRLDHLNLLRPSDPPFNGDQERYARETLWYGRKSMKHRQKAA